ncbi:hypothetical protein H4582DRAFT_986336 [Lactarius indigo]|nr:hypothetical protein H4582DRAFT_986336 [Lactarius indigo]
MTSRFFVLSGLGASGLLAHPPLSVRVLSAPERLLPFSRSSDCVMTSTLVGRMSSMVPRRTIEWASIQSTRKYVAGKGIPQHVKDKNWVNRAV